MYKSFRDQFKYCSKIGRVIHVKCPYCGRVMIFCMKYKKRCSSKVCLWERTHEHKKSS